MARLFRLLDPQVEVILISPYQLQVDMLAYYIKMLELNGVRDIENRLHIITPVPLYNSV